MSKRILVVDDDPGVLSTVKNKLQHGGYTVDTASNGKAALHFLKREKIDLIITDISMPEIDGVDLFKEVRASERTMNTPVIVITENQDYRRLFHQLGVHHFLEKPIDGKRLLSAVEDTFHKVLQKGKVLMVGTDKQTLDDAVELLEKEGIDGISMIDVGDFFAIALTVAPKIILVDLLLEQVSAREVVKALRCFIRLRDTVIMVYTHFDPENLTDVDMIEQLKGSKDDCLELGAQNYMGRFSRSTFLDIIRQYI